VKRLAKPPYSCLITTGQATARNFELQKTAILETLRHAAADGVSMVQLREKALPARLLFELAAAAVHALADTSTLVLINDRADIAKAAHADGVHLPANSLPADTVRRAFGKELIIGRSTHSIERAVTAAASGADYIFFGPVFETPGKSIPVGLEKLKEVSQLLGSFPVIALGGITQHNFRDVISAGAQGVAAIRSLNESDSRRRICSGLAAI
jgi:thiamine-phosphate pyrophosphorylase